MLFAHLLLRVEFEDFNHGLRVFLVVFFRNCGSRQEFLPLLWKSTKTTCLRIEANVYAVAEIGRIADTPHSRTSLVDLIDPIVDLVIALDTTSDGLRGKISIGSITSLAVFRIRDSRDLECHPCFLGPRTSGYSVERDSLDQFAIVALHEIELEFSQDQIPLVPPCEHFVFFASYQPLLYDGNSA